MFDGTNPNGTWKLFVFDDSSDDVGQFDLGWSLEILTSDTTAPKVMSTSPATIAPTANVTATFTEAMDAQRNRRGSEHDHRHDLQAGPGIRTPTAPQPRVTAAVRYVARTHKEGDSRPGYQRQLGADLQGTAAVRRTQDPAGNSLDQNPNLGGNQPKSWKFTVQ